MTKHNIIGLVGLFLFFGILFFAGVLEKNNEKIYIPYTQFIEYMEERQISEVILTGSAKMEVVLNNDDQRYVTDNPRNSNLKELLLLNGISVKEGNGGLGQSLVQSFFSLSFLAAIIFVLYKTTGKNKLAMSMNMSELSDSQKIGIDFKNIAGNEEAKDSVSDIVDFIKNPEKYDRYGARMPKGVIFYGSPGTGKTLMAKAIAGEAGVPFYAVSGSDFVQMYVGVGAARIRELFKKARESGKAVIFIDEIDALGKKRSANPSGGNDERDQTLNALLTEMSGFSSKEGIVVIAATNRIELLDEALLRPGRFDRQIEISLPDVLGREKILQIHASGKPLADDVDIRKLAVQTVYFSGAMLENLLNEAAIIAAKKELDIISREDIEKAYYTVVAGSEKKDRSNIREKDRMITAYHEAGHALVTKITAPENKIPKITIIPSTKGAGGFCVNIPEDKLYMSKKEIHSQIMINYGGRAAEEIVFGSENITTGASNDIEKATGLIKNTVEKYGMGVNTDGLLNITMFTDEKNSIFKECSEIAAMLYSETKKIIVLNRDKLDGIALKLLEKETLDDKDLDCILAD